MSSYTDAQYQGVQRIYVGLTAKHGGAASAALAAASSHSTWVTRFYPGGPTTLKKWGFRLLATTAGHSENIKLFKGGSAGTLVSTLSMASTMAMYTGVASEQVDYDLAKTDYLTVIASSFSSASGSVALFFDIQRLYDPATWEA